MEGERGVGDLGALARGTITMSSKALKKWIAYAAVLIVISAAIVIRTVSHTNSAVIPVGPAETHETLVSVAPLTIVDGYDALRRFSGRIEPRQSVDIAFDEAGKLDALLAEEGTTVPAGVPLARLDIELLEIRRDRLEGLLVSAREEERLLQSSFKREQDLARQNLTRQSSVDTLRISLTQSQGRIADLKGQIAVLEARIRRATLKAPFSGSVSQHFADTGSSVEAGQPILRLIETGPLDVRIGVDGALADKLSIGGTRELRIGTMPARARITAILPNLDPATLTRTVLFEVQDAPGIVAGGVATLELSQQVPASGASVAVNALRDGSRGLWEIMVAVPQDGGHRIAVEAVEILHVDDEQAFIRGTFASDALVVVEGHHRLVPGQSVVFKR